MTRTRKGFFAQTGTLIAAEQNRIALEAAVDMQAALSQALRHGIEARLAAQNALGGTTPSPAAAAALERLRRAIAAVATCEREVAEILVGSELTARVWQFHLNE